MHAFSARAAFRQLEMARPKVARRYESEIRAMLDEVSNAAISRYLTVKPRSTTIYLGDLDTGTRGVCVKLDSVGRINCEFVEIPKLMRSYGEHNHLATVLDSIAPAPVAVAA